MDEFISLVPGLLGVDRITFYATLAMVATIANLLGRLIPDSATGPLGIVRKVCKVLGLYVSNRISPHVTTNQVARAVVAAVPDSKILGSSEDLQAAVRLGVPYGENAGEFADAILDTAAGRTQGIDPGDGRDGQSVPEEYRTDPFRKGARTGFQEPGRGK